jgi:hypothetical protein
MRETLQQPDLVTKVQHDIATRIRELDLVIDEYAKLLVELELLELQSQQASGPSKQTRRSQRRR